MNSMMASYTAAPHTLMASNGTSNKGNDQFDDWVLSKQGVRQGSRSESVTTMDSSSWSWFEPLENIISSRSTSSVGSPMDDQRFAPEKVTVADEIFDNSGQFFNDPSSYANSPELLPVVKREESDESNDTTGAGLLEDLATLKDPAAANGKKKRAPRKRLTSHQKQAHNKIEKRYRININTKIAKLQQIIPWVASEQTAFEVGDSMKKEEDGTQQKDGTIAETPISAVAATKLNKSMILEKAVDYILYLQNSERLYEMEVQRLKNEVDTLKKNR